jgi:glycosyltransferase involved in cell wall biosynthesis
MKICFLTSGHDPLDDRIFYHMAATLYASGYDIEIVSSRSDLTKPADGIKMNCFYGNELPKREKTEQFIQKLTLFMPEVIICSEPLPLYAAHKYSMRQKKKIRIIYDITEFYPLRSHLNHYHPLFKGFHFIKLLIFNLWVSGFADSLIFGEWYKSRLYRIIFPFKPFIFIPYYPDLDLISTIQPDLKEGKLRLSYSGNICLNRGFKNLFDVINKLILNNPDLKIELRIIGWFETVRDKDDCEYLMKTDWSNLHLEIIEKQSYKSFLSLIRNTDIFIDLRSDSFMNQYNLPVKLFLYAALGRPTIISDLKAIRKDYDFSCHGFLVQPSATDSIVILIENYLEDKGLYLKHCRCARESSELYHNWNKIKHQFLGFINPQDP